MHGYICIYRGERYEVRTNDGTLAAQNTAVAYFQRKYPRRKVKGWEVSVTLAELPNGEAYIHTAVD